MNNAGSVVFTASEDVICIGKLRENAYFYGT